MKIDSKFISLVRINFTTKIIIFFLKLNLQENILLLVLIGSVGTLLMSTNNIVFSRRIKKSRLGTPLIWGHAIFTLIESVTETCDEDDGQ